jgi:hypothetical protein
LLCQCDDENDGVLVGGHNYAVEALLGMAVMHPPTPNIEYELSNDEACDNDEYGWHGRVAVIS